MDKTYSVEAIQNKWNQRWEEERQRRAKATKEAAGDKENNFTILMPPPNVTGVLHMGHALNNTLQDIVCRTARLQGKNVLWIPGVDHAGIATQNKVEKILKQEGKTRQQIGYDAFIQRVEDWRKKHGTIIFEQLRQLGVSCDWDRKVYTRDPAYTRMVMLAFKKLYDRGLIYKGKRLVNWCPVSQTALSDEEVIMKETKGTLYYIRYKLSAGNLQACIDHQSTDDYITEELRKGYIIIATTRPETIMGDVAIAVHPVGRYKELIGQFAEYPLKWDPNANKNILDDITNLRTSRVKNDQYRVLWSPKPCEPMPNLRPIIIPIIVDDAVDKNFGTGAVKITPAHDPLDFEIMQRYNEQHSNDLLEPIEVLDARGHVKEDIGKFGGMDRFQARKAVVEKLREMHLIVKEEPYEHNVGYSERADVPIEPRLSEQWFFHYPEEIVEDALRAVEDGCIYFNPVYWTKVYEHWLKNLHDWCISRQLWWGHRIPVWYKKEDPSHMEVFVDGPSDPENWEQDPSVLDTWFSSWLWPLGTLGYDLGKSTDAQDVFFKQHFPTNMMICGSDILFFWVTRMIMASLLFIDKKDANGNERPLKERIPFKQVVLHGIVRDAQGRKMSKSLGNSPDPVDLIKQYGADAVRLGLVGSSAIDSVRFDEQRIKLARNFCTKLWNACRFRLQHGGPSKDTRVTDCLDRIIEGLEAYKKWHRRYDIPGTSICTPEIKHPSGFHVISVASKMIPEGSVLNEENLTRDRRAQMKGNIHYVDPKTNEITDHPVLSEEVRAEIEAAIDKITLEDCYINPPNHRNCFKPSMKDEEQQLSCSDLYLLHKIATGGFFYNIEPTIYSCLETNMQWIMYWIRTEFCDFYIEMQKFHISPYGAAVMDGVLQIILCAFYPYIPYVTSEIWERLYPQLGSIEANNPFANKDVVKRWETIRNYFEWGNADGEQIEKQTIEGTSCTYTPRCDRHIYTKHWEDCDRLKSIMKNIRTLKEQYPGRPGTQMVYICRDRDINFVQNFIEANAESIAEICGIKGLEYVKPDFIQKNQKRLRRLPRPDTTDPMMGPIEERLIRTAMLFNQGGELYIEFDEQAADDQAATQAEMDALRQHIQAAEQKLNNPKFLSQAPANVQEGVRRLMEQNKQKLALLEKLQSQ